MAAYDDFSSIASSMPSARSERPNSFQPTLDEALRVVQLGDELLKLSRTGRLELRKFRLDLKTGTLYWYSSSELVDLFRSKTRSIRLTSIREVHIGQQGSPNFAAFRAQNPELVRMEPRSFYLVLSNTPDRRQTLDLIARNAQALQYWTMALNFAVFRKNAPAPPPPQPILVQVHTPIGMHYQWLRRFWDRYITMTTTQRLQIHVLWEVISSMKLGLRKVYVDRLVDAFRSRGKTDLTFEEFSAVILDLCTRPEIVALFDAYAAPGKGYWTAETLERFIHTEQRDNTVDIYACRDIIEEFDGMPILDGTVPQGEEELGMHLFGFLRFMTSFAHNSAFSAKKQEDVYQDMDQPFAHYFIASAAAFQPHDLKHRQQALDLYRNLLRTGCRCLEIQVFRVGTQLCITPTPFMHGDLITVADVLRTIEQFGFESSHFPLVLSFDMHLDEPDREAVARMITQTFGQRLYHIRGFLDRYLTPRQLAGRVLVKMHTPGFSDDSGVVTARRDGRTSSFQDWDESWADRPSRVGPYPGNPRSQPWNDVMAYTPRVRDDGFAGSSTAGARQAQIDLSEVRMEAAEFEDTLRMTSPEAMDEGRKSLTASALTVRGGYGKWQGGDPAPGRIYRVASKAPRGLTEFTKKYIIQAYGRNQGLEAPNYDAIPLWTGGVQICSLNYLIHDRSMYFNAGKFRDNGSSGYVLKPLYMRAADAGAYADLFSLNLQPVMTLKVKIISGQQLYLEGEDAESTAPTRPYVELEMVGAPADCRYYKTGIQRNGFDPVWNQNYEFPLAAGALALLRIAVYNLRPSAGLSDDLTASRAGSPAHPLASSVSSMQSVALGNNGVADPLQDRLIGHEVIPISAMQLGFRHVHLKTASGAPIPHGTVFCHFSYE
eukprot:tig00021521_g22093.t1